MSTKNQEEENVSSATASATPTTNITSPTSTSISDTSATTTIGNENDKDCKTSLLFDSDPLSFTDKTIDSPLLKRKSKNPEELFDWMSNINKGIRGILRNFNEKGACKLLQDFIRHIKEDFPNYVRYINKCQVLARTIVSIGFLLKNLNGDYDDSDEFLYKMTDLLAHYTEIELRIASKLNVSKFIVSERISKTYNVLLKNADGSFIIRIFLLMTQIYRQTEIMSHLFEKYLKPRTYFKSELPDKLYIMNLIALRKWKSMGCTDDNEKIIKYAECIKPKSSFRFNSLYAPFLDITNIKDDQITEHVLSQSAIKRQLFRNVIFGEESTNVLPQIIDLCEDVQPEVSKCRIELNEITTNQISNDDSNKMNQIINENRIKKEQQEIVDVIDLTDDQKFIDLEYIEFLIEKANKAQPASRNLMALDALQAEIICLDDEDDDDVREIPQEQHQSQSLNENPKCNIQENEKDQQQSQQQQDMEVEKNVLKISDTNENVSKDVEMIEKETQSDNHDIDSGSSIQNVQMNSTKDSNESTEMIQNKMNSITLDATKNASNSGGSSSSGISSSNDDLNKAGEEFESLDNSKINEKNNCNTLNQSNTANECDKVTTDQRNVQLEQQKITTTINKEPERKEEKEAEKEKEKEKKISILKSRNEKHENDAIVDNDKMDVEESSEKETPLLQFDHQAKSTVVEKSTDCTNTENNEKSVAEHPNKNHIEGSSKQLENTSCLDSFFTDVLDQNNTNCDDDKNDKRKVSEDDNEINETVKCNEKNICESIEQRSSPDLFLFRDREDEDEEQNNYDSNNIKLNTDTNNSDAILSEEDDEIKSIAQRITLPPLKTYERKKNSSMITLNPHIRDNVTAALDPPVFSPFSSELSGSRSSSPIDVLNESMNQSDVNNLDSDVIVPKVSDISLNKNEKLFEKTSENTVVFSASSCRKLQQKKWKEPLKDQSTLNTQSSNVIFSTEKPITIGPQQQQFQQPQKERFNNDQLIEPLARNATAIVQDEIEDLRSPPVECFSESDADEICQLIGKNFSKNREKGIENYIKLDDKISSHQSMIIDTKNHELDMRIEKKQLSEIHVDGKFSSLNAPSVAGHKRKSVSFAEVTQERSSSVISLINSFADPLILDRKSYETVESNLQPLYGSSSSSASVSVSSNSNVNKSLIQPVSFQRLASSTLNESKFNNQHNSYNISQHHIDSSSNSGTSLKMFSSATQNTTNSGMVKNMLNLESEDSNQLSVFNQIVGTEANYPSNNKTFNDGTSCEKDNNLSTSPKLKYQIRKDLLNVEYLSQMNFQSHDGNANENSANTDYNFLPEITGDEFSEEELEKYFSPVGSGDTFETASYKDIPPELLPLLYNDKLGKKFEGQVVLPLKKRRKLSQFSDNASIKDEDIQFFDSHSQKQNTDIGRDVCSSTMKNDLSTSIDGISYPSTPMLSIANFENIICFPQKQSARRFKTPAQLKEVVPIAPVMSVAPGPPVASIAPVASVAPVSSISTMTTSSTVNPIGAVNLQTFNILSASSPHTIVNNNGRNCNKITNSMQAFNILQPQQTVVNNTGGVNGNVQTFNIISSSQAAGGTIPSRGNTGNVYPDNMSNLQQQQQQQQQPEINNMNVNFNLGTANDLSSLQAFNVNPNSLQYTQTFHPSPQYTYSIQSNPTQNHQLNQISLQSLYDIQNIINLSNYQMNPQHLSNFLHNSQFNLQAKQAVLVNDLNIPCNLQINTSGQRSYPEKETFISNNNNNNNNNNLNNGKCSNSNICDTFNMCPNHTKKCCCGDCKIESMSSSSSAVSISLSASTNCSSSSVGGSVSATASTSTRGRPKKCSKQATDRITRSSNRTAAINYKDDDNCRSTNSITPRKKKSTSNYRK